MIPKYEYVTFQTYFPSLLVKEKMKNILHIILISLFSLTVISCAKEEEKKTEAPVIAEVYPVTTPTSDPSPDYTFSSTEAGTITFG